MMAIPLLILAAIGLFLFAMVEAGANSLATRLASAIEVAEGYGVPGAIPTVNNNPGDLMNWQGSGLPSDPNGFAVFPSYAAGFQALVQKVQNILSSADPEISALAQEYFGVGDTSQLTIEQLAQIYSPQGADNWANNVAAELGVSPSTTIGSAA